MSSVVGLVFVLGGLLVGGLGARPFWTGKNYGGLLGRGWTKDDNLRLARAPAIYFRAVGAAVVFVGVGIVCIGVLSLLPADAPAPVLTVVAIFGAVAVLGILVSLAAVLVLSSRYKLFRWDKP